VHGPDAVTRAVLQIRFGSQSSSGSTGCPPSIRYRTFGAAGSGGRPGPNRTRGALFVPRASADALSNAPCSSVTITCARWTPGLSITQVAASSPPDAQPYHSMV
jgi:hypothetical protein